MHTVKSADLLAWQYAEGMSHHSFGHACYHRTSSKDVEPGSVGYFDHNGNWKKILSLRELQPSAKPVGQGISNKFTRLAEELTVNDDVEMDLEPLTSSRTVSTSVGFTLQVPIPVQVPVTLGTDNKYENTNTVGAVLVMKNPVVRSSIDDGTFLERWFNENSGVFPKLRSAVRDQGVWLVTSTYTSEQVALNVWQDKDKVVKLGLSAGIEGIFNLEPSIERGEARHTDGSFTYRAKWTTDKLQKGVSYLQDPRTWHLAEWTETERVGPDSKGKCVQAPESGEDSVTEDTETVGRGGSGKNAELTMKEIDEDNTLGSFSLSEVEIGDDTLRDKEDEEYDLASAVHDGNADRVRSALGRISEDTSQKEDYDDFLKDACTAGHEEIADLLIKAGADTNALGWHPYIPLIAASEKGHARVVQLLLGAGADPDISNDSTNALFTASKAGHDDVVLWLLAAGADVDQLASRISALQAAADGGHDQCVRWLIAAGADVDQQNEDTALCRAARKGYLGIVKQLLVAGADVNLQEEGQDAPLHAAAGSGRLEVVRCFLDAGADVNADGKSSTTPIAAAVRSGSVPVVKLLLDKLEASGKKRFGPALEYAVRQGDAEMLNMLLAAGAPPDGNSEETSEFSRIRTPLIIASQTGNEDLVTRLIKAGANVNRYFKRYTEKLTPLYAASMKGHLSIMRLLLDAGATVDDEADNLGTPFLVAVSEGQVEAANLLLDAGADLQARNQSNNYPVLMVASDRGHLNVVKALLDRPGVDVNAHGSFAYTALHAAAASGHLEVVNHLINAGANINDVGGYYGSALQAAAYKGHQAVAEKLLDVGADPALDGGEYGIAIVAAAAQQHVDVVRMFIERNVVTKEQAKKAEDRVEETIKSKHYRSAKFRDILEILSSVVE
ncbi:hypothetical protein IL306_000691 [Fusarium sp. DS 682]|nr:hypothetical protein IL306_000691 [Fusarium sp. DS 682]